VLTHDTIFLAKKLFSGYITIFLFDFPTKIISLASVKGFYHQSLLPFWCFQIASLRLILDHHNATAEHVFFPPAIGLP